jgi:GT2 family glycosyltransferase
VSFSLSNKPALQYSIIIVAYNNGDEILPCLNSLAKNAAHDRVLQIIIIDNASADGTQASIRAFQNRSHAIMEILSLFNRANRGFTAALNQGIRFAKAPFVLFLNPDTVLPENMLDTLRKILDNHSEAGVVAPQLRNADDSVQPSCRRFPQHRDVLFMVIGLAQLFKRSRFFNGWKMGDFGHRQSRYVDQPQGACLFTTKQILERVGEWDERFPMFLSDVDWCRRVADAGYKIRFTTGISVIHHQGKSVFSRRADMIL